mgnify:CR=1 FL=1
MSDKLKTVTGALKEYQDALAKKAGYESFAEALEHMKKMDAERIGSDWKNPPGLTGGPLPTPVGGDKKK